MEDSIHEESDAPALVEVTVRLWSLDIDSCEEEMIWRWRERPDGDADLTLFRLLREVIDQQIAQFERRRS